MTRRTVKKGKSAAKRATESKAASGKQPTRSSTKPRGNQNERKSPKPPAAKRTTPRAEETANAGLRHDTPLDMPAVTTDDPPPRQRPYSVTALAKQSGHSSLIDRLNAGEKAHPEGVTAAEQTLSRLAMIETLEEGYDAWRELSAEHAQLRARYAEERERLEREGAFLLGAVRAAGQGGHSGAPGGDSLSTRGGLSSLVAEADARLNAARTALDAEITTREAAFAAAFSQVKQEIQTRVERYAAGMKVALKLLIRSAGATRTILHLERLSPDESVVLLYLVHGTIPTRHGFLFDDSTEDVSLAPAPLYPDDGLDTSQTRPDGTSLRARMTAPNQQALPLKGFIPVFVQSAAGTGDDFFRLLQRGAVMEVEVLDGDAFRNVLTREESERFAGHLLRLKLSGRAELEIVAG